MFNYIVECFVKQLHLHMYCEQVKVTKSSLKDVSSDLVLTTSFAHRHFIVASVSFADWCHVKRNNSQSKQL
jgi:hypothetical protein